MPAPSAAMLIKAAKQNFAARDIRLPVQWKDMGRHYTNAFAADERVSQANSAANLFGEPTRNRYHTGAARTVGLLLEDYIESICSAICQAIAKWMQSASVVSLTINGPAGTLLPGGVIGPLLKPFILASAPQTTDSERRYSQAIAQAVSARWQQWQQGLGGILNYPSFAAAPMPAAPPTANVPSALMTLTSTGETGLSPLELKNAMATAYGPGDDQHAHALFDAVAKAFYTQFQRFKTSTLVSGVMGTGAVTTPPAGPVTNGTVIPTPGNFL